MKCGRSSLLLLAVLGCGCSGSRESLFPLKVGNAWNYTIRGGFVTRVDSIKVDNEISVAGTKGWRLVGQMGMSRVAWKNGVLYAEEVPGCRFYPAAPILNAAPDAAPMVWKGRLWVMGRAFDANATVGSSKDKFEIAGRKYDAVVSTVSLSTGQSQIELKTWYVDGIGPVRQEQRIDGTLFPAATYLSGP